MSKIGLLLLVVGSLVIAGFALQREPAKAAAGPCNPASSTVTGEEAQFLALVQQWRNANVQNSVPLQLSAPLNAAAAWFAEYQIANGLQGGHLDNFGRNWAQRAADCGYDSSYSFGSGEGIYARAGSVPLTLGPTNAIAGITYPGSGIYIETPNGVPPPKCVGVAVARNQNGSAVAWVLVIAQYPANQQCPQPVTGGGGGTTPSPSPSPSATNTPTATPTKTPTPTPTPNANYNGQIRLNSGWNLVTLPAGSLTDILDTARGCFSAVYQMEGDHWRRYVPGAPAYASNLSSSTGGAFWVLGTEANCGLIRI